VQYLRRMPTPKKNTEPRIPGARRFTAARRTLFAAAAALLAVPALLAVTAGPASAASATEPAGTLLYENAELANQGSGLCLDDYGTIGTQIVNAGCVYSPHEWWDIIQVGTVGGWPLVQLYNPYWQECLDSSGSDIGAGGPIYAWTCSASDPFTEFVLYTYTTTPGGTSYMNLESWGAAQATGQALSVDANAYNDASGDAFQQYPTNLDDAYQQFTVAVAIEQQ
jgi:hypothetical protein